MKLKVIINWVAVIWTVLILGMLTGGWWVFRVQVNESQNRAIENIESIAKLKLVAIEQFLGERLGDVLALSEDELLIDSIVQWRVSFAPDLEAKIMNKFKIMMEKYHYSNVVLADTSGKIQLSILPQRQQLEKDPLLSLESSLNSGKPVIVDLHRDSLSGKPHLGLVAPVFQVAAGEKNHIGFLILEMDPALFLFPLIESWPILSGSAETLIVRRQGEKVFWLNNTRFKPDSALKMEQQLSEIELPAVQAVLGSRGIFRGKDYRGVEVISYLSKIPHSSWFMVSKVDKQEVFANAYQKASSYFVLMILFLILTVAITFNLNQRIRYLSLSHEKDKEIGQYAAQLENINKELEAFSYSISHDLKAPLRAITGYASILFEEYSAKLDQEAKRLINVIHENVNKMGCLIDDLLTLSHAGRHAMQSTEVKVNEIAQAAYDELKTTLPAHRKVQLTIRDLPPAQADSTLLKQVLLNLISNALKFTSLKEVAVIEVGGQSGPKENVYYVKDNGAGFDMKYMDKLFGVFSRLHSQDDFGGTGIGLAIVKNAVVRMGGKVWAQGQVDQGASFYFSLPKGGKNG